MCLLLKRAIKMPILSLEVCTNCDTISRVLRGELVYDNKGPLQKLYDFMKFMRGYFEELMCRLVPRESMMFVNSLMRKENVHKDMFNSILLLMILLVRKCIRSD